MIFADAAATTPVRREVLEAMWPYLAGGLDGAFGNPSSVHAAGAAAAEALQQARIQIAAELDCRPSELVFTSGGTEADNLAVKGIALGAPRGLHLLTTAIEHEAVLASADYLRRHHGFDITMVDLDDEGRVDVERFAALIRPDTTLVSIHHANNEIGTVQPIAELADIARATGVPFHTDAVQSTGWLPVGRGLLGVDALSVSGHKLGAPKGVGALVILGGISLEPVLHGGGQERGRRSGTENVAGAVGLAAALLAAQTSRGRAAEVAAASAAIIDRVLAEVPGAQLTGSRTARLPNHASFVFPGTNGEAVLLELERRGVLSSSGSACAAGRDEPAHVLLALGVSPELAQTSVRFTLDASIDLDQAEQLARHTVAAVHALGTLAR